MSEPFLGDITVFAGNFAPQGWEFCNGQLLPIAQYDALYALLGTIYGGDGQTTFALPDLRGRSPVHAGTLAGGGVYTQGQNGGAESVTLTTNQIPSHSHTLAAGAQGTQASPAGGLPGTTPARDFRYSSAGVDATLHPTTLQTAGGSQPHNNLSPYLGLSFIIAVAGIFPSRN